MPETSWFEPSAVIVVEIDGPVADINASRSEGGAYTRAHLIVRLHEQVVGIVEVQMKDGHLSAASVVESIWESAAGEINAHLRADGLQSINTLSTAGVGAAIHPLCWSGTPEGDDAPLVSVIIATKDRTTELEGCLSTLLEQSYDHFEVIVVDNGPSDESTQEMVEEVFAHEPRVRYIREAVAGTSNARNKGIAAANGSIIAFTDDDVIVDRNWLKAIVRRFTLSLEADCVTGLILPAELETPSQQWFEEYGGFNKGFSAKLRTAKRTPDDSILHPYTAGKFGSGNNVAYRRQRLVDLGGFDPKMGPGTPTPSGEELDTFLGIVTTGGTIAYEPAAVISHFHRRDFEGLKKQIRNYGMGLSALMVKWMLKHPKHGWAILSRVPMGVWFVLSPKSSKNEKRTTNFPQEISREELIGMAKGPLPYLRGRFFKP